jgi:Transposase DDE domain
MQALVGNILDRCITDAGYRGHNAPPDYKFKVYTTGQSRLTPQIKREFKRRAAIEPVIGHLKEHHRMGRNHLAHASGNAINAVLAAVGYNFRRLLAWLSLLLLRILIALGLIAQLKSICNRVSSRTTDPSLADADSQGSAAAQEYFIRTTVRPFYPPLRARGSFQRLIGSCVGEGIFVSLDGVDGRVVVIGHGE